jgi:hypothetical protein
MNIARLTARYSLIGVFVVVSFAPRPAFAQGDHSHATAPQSPALTQDERTQASAFVKAVREATRRFRDVAVAEAEGYALQFGCVSGSDAGAMGVHFVNGPLVVDDVLDVDRPELLVYEPLSNGRFQIIAADYLVLAETWHATHSAPPQLMGQLFHLFESPNRFGLPAFYTLHVWAWKENPKGAFVNWHPNVSCDAFNPPTP